MVRVKTKAATLPDPCVTHVPVEWNSFHLSVDYPLWLRNEFRAPVARFNLFPESKLHIPAGRLHAA